MNKEFEIINKNSIMKLDQTKGDDKDMSDRMDDAVKKHVPLTYVSGEKQPNQNERIHKTLLGETCYA